MGLFKYFNGFIKYEDPLCEDCGKYVKQSEKICNLCKEKTFGLGAFIKQLSISQTEEEFTQIEKRWIHWREFEIFREVTKDVIEGIMLS